MMINSTAKNIIIVGHYGSGKTEFAVNHAMTKRKKGQEVSILDLDIVNPYFRSRDVSTQFAEYGIEVVSSSIENGGNTAVPSLSPALMARIKNPKGINIIDSGGDSVGAKVLGRFQPYINQNDYEMWMVVNINRPDTDSVTKIIEIMDRIEESTKLKISGLVNNTNLLKHTTCEHILQGYEVCKRVGEIKSVPVKYNCIESNLEECKKINEIGNIQELKLFLRPSWLQGDFMK